MTLESARAIVITGPVGAGKSTTAWALREVLGKRGIANALFDMDYLRMVYPEPVGDRFGSRIGTAVLADAWRHMQAADYGPAGPMRVAIIADVVETPDHRRTYEHALPGVEVTIVRLDVSLPVLAARLANREKPDDLPWYLARAPELQQMMEDTGVGDITISVTTESPDEIATLVANRLGLIDRNIV